MSEMAWERDCLACDPFDGDYGGSGDSDGVLSDKMVTCRKPAKCHLCEGEAVPGTRIRRRAEVYDGEFMRFAWCHPCCQAMAHSDGDDEAYMERQRIGDERRALERNQS